MTSERADTRAARALLLVAVCLVAANMRTTITGVGPLLEQMSADLATTPAVLGSLASVPLLAWAALSPFAYGLSQRFGMSRVVLWSLLALTAGTVWRSLPGVELNLWAGTVLIGAALAIANVLMPAVVKRDFPGRVPAVMGLYTALLGGVGALAAGIVVPISAAGDPPAGWRIALAATGVLLPVAAIAWAWATAGRAKEVVPPLHVRRRSTGIWRDVLAWQVASYMGTQAAVFYMTITWLAPLATSIGRDPVTAGFDVMFFQIVTIPGSLVLPFVLRGRARRWVPALLPVIGVLAMTGLLVAPQLIVFWAVVAGVSSGASLGMSLTLMAERARDHATASALSGMAQSVGYVIAAIGPVAFGLLHSLTGGWTASLLLLIAVLVVQGVVGVFVGRDRFVLEGRRRLGDPGAPVREDTDRACGAE